MVGGLGISISAITHTPRTVVKAGSEDDIYDRAETDEGTSE